MWFAHKHCSSLGAQHWSVLFDDDVIGSFCSRSVQHKWHAVVIQAVQNNTQMLQLIISSVMANEVPASCSTCGSPRQHWRSLYITMQLLFAKSNSPIMSSHIYFPCATPWFSVIGQTLLRSSSYVTTQKLRWAVSTPRLVSKIWHDI